MGLDKILNINKNLLKRIYTLLFLIPIYFFSIISSSYLSTAIILLTSLILSFEWFEITQEDKGKKNFILSQTFFKSLEYKNLSWLFYGFVYITIPLIIFFKIKEIENGNYILLWIFIIILTTDVFSYVFGQLIKGPKIFPALSPFKTYSGTFLGIITGSFFGIFFSLNYLYLDNKLIIIIFSILISISGLFGDLFISKIKRNFKVKDSGKILPGHGGFLDRYDSISFGLIALFFIQYFF